MSSYISYTSYTTGTYHTHHPRHTCTLALFPGLPRSLVCVDNNTRMRKGGEKLGRPGIIHHLSDVRWTWGGGGGEVLKQFIIQSAHCSNAPQAALPHLCITVNSNQRTEKTKKAWERGYLHPWHTYTRHITHIPGTPTPLAHIIHITPAHLHPRHGTGTPTPPAHLHPCHTYTPDTPTPLAHYTPGTLHPWHTYTPGTPTPLAHLHPWHTYTPGTPTPLPTYTPDTLHP